jgi:hypothetical protein
MVDPKSFIDRVELRAPLVTWNYPHGPFANGGPETFPAKAPAQSKALCLSILVPDLLKRWKTLAISGGRPR